MSQVWEQIVAQALDNLRAEIAELRAELAHARASTLAVLVEPDQICGECGGAICKRCGFARCACLGGG